MQAVVGVGNAVLPGVPGQKQLYRVLAWAQSHRLVSGSLEIHVNLLVSVPSGSISYRTALSTSEIFERNWN